MTSTHQSSGVRLSENTIDDYPYDTATLARASQLELPYGEHTCFALGTFRVDLERGRLVAADRPVTDAAPDAYPLAGWARNLTVLQEHYRQAHDLVAVVAFPDEAASGTVSDEGTVLVPGAIVVAYWCDADLPMSGLARAVLNRACVAPCRDYDELDDLLLDYYNLANLTAVRPLLRPYWELDPSALARGFDASIVAALKGEGSTPASRSAIRAFHRWSSVFGQPLLESLRPALRFGFGAALLLVGMHVLGVAAVWLHHGIRAGLDFVALDRVLLAGGALVNAAADPHAVLMIIYPVLAVSCAVSIVASHRPWPRRDHIGQWLFGLAQPFLSQLSENVVVTFGVMMVLTSLTHGPRYPYLEWLLVALYVVTLAGHLCLPITGIVRQLRYARMLAASGVEQ
jgi:hypothetical protein